MTSPPSALRPSWLPDDPDSSRSGMHEIVREAREMLGTQADAIVAAAARLEENFQEAAALILGRQGRLVVCGLGKSGLIGSKLAATMASTGTPSFFLHPGEALHGDLGMVRPGDTALMISNSGETEEIISLIAPLRALDVKQIAMVGNLEGTLAREADVVLDVSVEREACPHNLAPTTSTLVTLAVGDALAVALSKARGFKPVDFARFHPGGSLGRRLLSRVRDHMQTEGLPVVAPDQSLSEVVLEMTRGRRGLAVVVDEQRGVLGTITDGDLRRGFQREGDPMQLYARELMSQDPIVIHEQAALTEAEELMRTRRVSVVLAVDSSNTFKGIIDIFSRNT